VNESARPSSNDLVPPGSDNVGALVYCSSVRSTPLAPKIYRAFGHLGFRCDHSKMSSKRYSGEANEEFRNGDRADRPALATLERLGGCNAGAGVTTRLRGT
jgi:hypothetical protein